VISIKKFLALDTEADQTLMHVVRILIQGIGEHAIEGDAGEYARFRNSIQEISDALVDGISPAELLVHAGSVLNALDDYNGRTAAHQHLQTGELQHMVKMLTSTVKAVTAASNANASILCDIENRIVTISEIDDVRIIKAKLSDCLTEIRNEAERQQKETGDTIEQLNYELTQVRKRAETQLLPADGQDLITGLPLRSQAEAALAESGRSGAQAFAAILVLDRLQLLNQRFGREAGDEILVAFTKMVAKQLTPEDRLFRWGGPALLALLRRPKGIESVRSEVARIMATRLDHTIQTPSRSVLIPIAARWTLFPMMAAPRLIYQKIDAFAAKPVARESIA
jgi:GGDEF domain-containing protein